MASINILAEITIENSFIVTPSTTYSDVEYIPDVYEFDVYILKNSKAICNA